MFDSVAWGELLSSIRLEGSYKEKIKEVRFVNLRKWRGLVFNVLDCDITVSYIIIYDFKLEAR